MKLKSIKAYGFKSFADRIDIALKSNITAIVGPNGSGKSNIVDAVRWVLGEQSVKSLRGSNAMTDVIFKGSKSREPLKRAEVCLTFDNEDHFLNSDLKELEIKRVVYQTGESEYYLNNTKVRLKDITNLFLDSGAGIDSFNIIGQGNIESIVSSKPIDRRIIIEEAAGVLKYKKRKDESLRKLEKTKDNLEKVAFVIKELETTVLPLESQSKAAKKYLEKKSSLEELEIAFIATDIKNKNAEYQNLKQEVDWLEKEVFEITSKTTESNSELENNRLKILKLEEAIAEKNIEILKSTESIAAKTSEKEITLERQKYSVDESKINENLLLLKESEIKIANDLKLADIEKKEIEENLHKLENSLQEQSEYLSLETIKEGNLKRHREELKKSFWETKNRIEILENNIENDLKMPIAVKNVLNNPRLDGIHGTINQLIEVDADYVTMIDTALGASSNFVVVDTEASAKKAILYLKENRLGRATFFPLNIIKKKYIDEETKRLLANRKGFLGIASSLIKYDSKYQGIIENQLGNILVVDNIDTMNELGREINYRYRIVTLDGEILHTGGSMTGGSLKKNNSSLMDKVELEKAKSKVKEITFQIEKAENELSSYEIKLATISSSVREIENKSILKKEEQIRKINQIEMLERELTKKQNEQVGNENLLANTLDEQFMNILNSLQELEQSNALLKQEMETLKKEKSEISSNIALLEKETRDKNSVLNRHEQDLKKKEIALGKLDIQLDTLLVTLSENYNLTYEKAIMDYPLEIDYLLAKETVERLKKEMNALGTVNLGSIDEYNRLSTRFEFLKTQKKDLETSSDNLLEIISEMDEIMKSRFEETFIKINEEFQKVFKKLFKGGIGILKLTNPEDLLETGIDIIAEPPGKKLNNISLLSGGEKTLTAIALLFAILNIKPVPFCILDEVEAALDEANVDMFGAYLQSKKDKSEFILITHKKRTMEYADTLYGITMQESGVSKIVSVELENI